MTGGTPVAGSRTINYGRYELRHPWPADCFVQGSQRGLVVSKMGSRMTAFVEAFPRNPDTFIRGEGETMEAAEDAAWVKFSRHAACSHSNGYDRRGYKNGAGFCVDCGMFAPDVFDLAEIGSVCSVCGAIYWTEIGGVLYCQEHAPDRRPDGFIAGLLYELGNAAGGRPAGSVP